MIGVSACLILSLASHTDLQSGSAKPSRHVATVVFDRSLPALRRVSRSTHQAGPPSLTLQAQPKISSRRDMLVQSSALLALTLDSRRKKQIDASNAAANSALTSTLLVQSTLNEDPGSSNQEPPPPLVIAPEDLVEIYFGIGSFWHVQHELLYAEQRILGRTFDGQLTSRAGYAGGKSVRPCSARRNGHAEVVGLVVPAWSVGEFAKEYTKLFDKRGNEYTGDMAGLAAWQRVQRRRGDGIDQSDKGEEGREYRALIGLPGGVGSPLLEAVIDKLASKSLQLYQASGNDGDTLGLSKVWLYDTKEFPFYQAEVNQQYHDGSMPGEKYGNQYNNLRKKAYDEGRLSNTGCPDIVAGKRKVLIS